MKANIIIKAIIKKLTDDKEQKIYKLLIKFIKYYYIIFK